MPCMQGREQTSIFMSLLVTFETIGLFQKVRWAADTEPNQFQERKGLDKGERGLLPHHQGRRRRCEHSPPHPDARNKARVPPPPR